MRFVWYGLAAFSGLLATLAIVDFAQGNVTAKLSHVLVAAILTALFFWLGRWSSRANEGYSMRFVWYGLSVFFGFVAINVIEDTVQGKTSAGLSTILLFVLLTALFFWLGRWSSRPNEGYSRRFVWYGLSFFLGFLAISAIEDTVQGKANAELSTVFILTSLAAFFFWFARWGSRKNEGSPMRFVWYGLAVLFAMVTLALTGDVVQGKAGATLSSVMVSILPVALFFWLGYRASGKRGWVQARRTPSLPRASRVSKAVCAELFTNGPEKARRALDMLAVENGIPQTEIRKELIAALPLVLEHALADDIFSEEEEKAFFDLLELYSISSDEIPRFVHERIEQAGLLRDLINGVVRPRAQTMGIPFSLMKNEILVWTFPTVRVYEHRTAVEFVQDTKGVSRCVSKGVYWRDEEVRGRHVRRDFREGLGTGPMSVTNMFLYCQAGKNAMRISLHNIISVLPTKDSVIVNRDDRQSNPLELLVDDPWFVANVLVNAKNWQ